MPIYDGRAGIRHRDRAFDFSDDDFASLSSWPRFPEKEVPFDAALAVGYTARSYVTSSQTGTDYLNLSTNILFVVVLGLFDQEDPTPKKIKPCVT